MLKEIGFSKITEATNGSEGLKCLKSLHGTPGAIQIVLTDFEMPQMSGLELLRSIRQSPDFGKLPVVYMSSKGDFSVVTDFIVEGVDQMVVKPFKKEDLLGRLSEAWKKRNG